MGYAESRSKQGDWQLRRALMDEIRRHQREAALPKEAIPAMQMRLRELCERRGWPVPEEAGQ